VRTNNTF